VLKPNATLSIAEGMIQVATLADHNLYLTFGNPDTTPGVRFGYTVTMPSGFTGGSFQWTQVVVSTNIFITDTAGNVVHYTGGNAVDTRFSYPFIDQGVFLEDSPSDLLDPDSNRNSRSDSFVSYVMFRPDGANSIWVPLRQIPWTWSGSATRTGTPTPNTWVLDPGSSHQAGPDVNSTAEPTWQGRIQDTLHIQ
jgi:hypothetical protein